MHKHLKNELGGNILLSIMSLILFVIVIISVEFGLRLARGFAHPLLPYYYDDSGVPRLPSNADLAVNFSNQLKIRYVTDQHGARVRNSSSISSKQSASIYTIGDSQALGYGLPFEQTFSFKLKTKLAKEQPVSILASPAIDIELSALAACEDAKQIEETPGLVIITVNLGNDLDEMYSGARLKRGLPSTAAHSWLIQHSQIYASYLTWRSRSTVEGQVYPGLNLILYRLDSVERILLAQQVSKSVNDIINCIGNYESLHVLLIPSDFQVDPDELLKYAPYSSNLTAFDSWLDKRTHAAAMMNSLESYIATTLLKQGISTISLRQEAKQNNMPARSLFANDSHHLTPLAHTLIADSVMRRERISSDDN